MNYGQHVTRYTKDGVPFTVWERNPMARILEQILNSVVYLYQSEEAAKRGDQSGGSGFLVGVPSEQHKLQFHVYAVSNHHVVGQKYSVIRITTAKGGTKILPMREQDWIHHPDGDDLSICSVLEDSPMEPISFVPLDMFLRNPLDIVSNDIGPGNDVFMVGRFITNAGIQQNNPMVRFGHISMMPDPRERIENSFTGIKQESFLIECHSISGFSGSPVFVHVKPGDYRPDQFAGIHEAGKLGFISRGYWLRLLGVDWGHLPHYDIIVDKQCNPLSEGWRVKTNSAIMAAVPAWKLEALIMNSPELKQQRAKADENQAKRLKKVKEAEETVVLDSVPSPEPEFSKDDFEAALRKVSRKIMPEQP